MTSFNVFKEAVVFMGKVMTVFYSTETTTHFWEMATNLGRSLIERHSLTSFFSTLYLTEVVKRLLGIYQ